MVCEHERWMELSQDHDQLSVMLLAVLDARDLWEIDCEDRRWLALLNLGYLYYNIS
jgi:hypothetical protein